MSPDRADPMATSVLFDVFVLGQAVRRLLMSTMADGPLRPEEYAWDGQTLWLSADIDRPAQLQLEFSHSTGKDREGRP